jgi:hypothetical protein
VSSVPDSTNSSADPPATPGEYLARVGARLGGLPERERREALDELRSHIAERHAGLADADAAARLCAELGTPEGYAAAFLAEYGAPSEPPPAATAGAPRRARLVAGVGLAILALLLVGFGLINALAPPTADPGWLRWRDVGLGRRGWLVLFLASWLLAAAAAGGALALLRRHQRREP